MEPEWKQTWMVGWTRRGHTALTIVEDRNPCNSPVSLLLDPHCLAKAGSRVRGDYVLADDRGEPACGACWGGDAVHCWRVTSVAMIRKLSTLAPMPAAKAGA